MADTELVVIQEFGPHKRGAVISDPAEMAEAPAHCVVRRAKVVLEAEAPAAEPVAAEHHED